VIREQFERLAATNAARRALAVSRVLLPLLAFAYLAFVLRRLLANLPPLAQIVPALWIAALIAACFPAILLLLAWKWKAVLELVGGRRLRLQPTYAFYCETNIQKYLPSNVLHYASRVAHAKRRVELEAPSMGKALFIEVVLDLLLTGVFLCGCVLVLCLGPRAIWLTSSWRPFAAAGLLVTLGLATVPVLRQAAAPGMTWWRAGGVLALATLAEHLYLGGAFVLLLYALGVGMDWAGVLTVMFWQSGSWLVGFLTPGLPGGIGVREALLAATVGRLVDVRDVLIAAALYRVAQIAGEALAFAVSVRLLPQEAVKTGRGR
jgi:glycosyltransferase 2 family protein